MKAWHQMTFLFLFFPLFHLILFSLFPLFYFLLLVATFFSHCLSTCCANQLSPCVSFHVSNTLSFSIYVTHWLHPLPPQHTHTFQPLTAVSMSLSLAWHCPTNINNHIWKYNFLGIWIIYTPSLAAVFCRNPISCGVSCCLYVFLGSLKKQTLSPSYIQGDWLHRAT